MPTPTLEDPPIDDDLTRLEREVARDLDRLNLPPANWPVPHTGPDGRPMADVLVVGAGMAGIALGMALRFKGVHRLRVLDRAPPGREGPWVTYARMETLRSPKHLTGPVPNIPSLTYRAWHEARFGDSGWRDLAKIPRGLWMDYLTWLGRMAGLEVENGVAVQRVTPEGGHVRIDIQGGDGPAHARHVVLATGFAGAGGPFIPDVVSPDLWPGRAAHTMEPIDFAKLTGKRIAVLGAGASAWDNAACALEAGAAAVDMYVRRHELPQVNKGRGSAYPGFLLGFGALSDAERWATMAYLSDSQAPPPHETVHRVLRHGGFASHLGMAMTSAAPDGGGVAMRFTGQSEPRTADFLILGTGIAVDLGRQNEIAHLASEIATWSDRYTPPLDLARPHLGRYPYLAADFGFTERTPGARPGLDRVHLFNTGAALSHGAVSGDIPGIALGAERLALALTQRLFAQDLPALRRRLEDWVEPELQGTPYFTL
ncbi:NAD(P)-binding domain-containing protein [Marinivivus vitaminiproducens]|uniref:NAD(P)-binding domain-containing protein n=1 Tax=Marinivivus vitaminiproducens TaxID=3035935 RepID=UPI0027A67814|nr:NAD(P)/FAD-dependent oxidoreductase [Geminicoccaceae bacterium SCSIO 64248]